MSPFVDMISMGSVLMRFVFGSIGVRQRTPP
jgi:hypothetical protein